MCFTRRRLVEIMAYDAARNLTKEKRKKLIERVLRVCSEKRILDDFQREYGIELERISLDKYIFKHKIKTCNYD